MMLPGRVKGDRIGWLRVSQSQSVISGCNQVDLVEGFGFGFGLLDKWVLSRVGLESGPLGRVGKQNRRPKQDGFEEKKDQFEVFMNPRTLPVCTWIELFLFSLLIRIFS